MSRLLLKPKSDANDWLTKLIHKIFGGFFGLFNKFFNRASRKYGVSVKSIIGRRSIAMIVYAILLFVTYGMFQKVPTGFIPSQDKQYLISFAQLPDGATLERTESVIREMSDIAINTEGVSGAVAFPGLSINGFSSSSSAGIVFVTLEDFDKREDPSKSAFAISQKLQKQFGGIEEAFIAIFPPPPVRGLGTTGGFKLQIQDRGDKGYQELQAVLDKVMQKAYQAEELSTVYSNYKISVPQLYVELDRTKAKQLGLNIDDIFASLQIYLGSYYINDFNKFGRTYQVIAQADKKFRDDPGDIGRIKVKNNVGQMVPLDSVVKVSETFGPESAQRYNAFKAADLNGNASPGYSSGQAQDAIESILDETLPKGFDFEWTELTYQQILAGDTTIYVIPLVLLLVFLVLAAQYESLTLPLAIILIVPMSMLSALIGVDLSGGDNNIFTQISLFVLMGLATKNAILIVEFAKELEDQGRSITKAAIEASKLRLRPILMTSFAFIMGVLPMAVSTGAGSEMRNDMGIAVFSGMLGVTFFGLLLTPVFYVILRKLVSRNK
jgi:multidrug efflux pump